MGGFLKKNWIGGVREVKHFNTIENFLEGVQFSINKKLLVLFKTYRVTEKYCFSISYLLFLHLENIRFEICFLFYRHRGVQMISSICQSKFDPHRLFKIFYI